MTPPEALPPDEPAPSTPRTWIVVSALVAGVALFAAFQDVATHPQYLAIAAVAAVALLPKPAAALGHVLDRIRQRLHRRRWTAPLLVFVASAAYLRYVAWLAGRELYPCFHDEYMYLLQARLLSVGRLWMPAHPLADFFDSFFVIVRPVYAPMYFPGAALAYVPGVWLGLSPWVTAGLITSLAVALLYHVTRELLDGVAGLLAVLLALSLEDVRIVSFMTMSHTVMLLQVLLAAAAYLRWRRDHCPGWAGILGAIAGWAAITRPVDAACLVLPLIAAMLWDLRRSGFRRPLLAVGVLAIAASPFIGLQLVFDKGVTGHWLRSPIAMYNDANLPGAAMGASTPGPSPSHLPQVRDYHQKMVDATHRIRRSANFVETWLRDRLLPTADVALPAHLLFVLLPAGLLGCVRRPPLAALLVGAIALPFVYAFWPFFLAHYAVVTVPIFLILVLVGRDVVRRRFPRSDAALAVAILLLAVGGMPLWRPVLDRFPQAPTLGDVRDKLARLDHLPAVVLFRYESGGPSIHEEPVYNIVTAWPDDAAVIRAHDLGPRNIEIFRYYAQRQPERFFFRYDRTTQVLTPLGTAGELMRKPAAP